MEGLSSLFQNFQSLACQIHKKTLYEHVCSLDSCNFQHIIYCGQCVLEEENHTLQHKTFFKPLTSYLNDKVELLAGKTLQNQIVQLLEQTNEERNSLKEKMNKINEKIEKDFHEIQSSVMAYCSEIKSSLQKEIDVFQKKNFALLQDIENRLNQNMYLLEGEKYQTIKEFEEILNNNFDFSNHRHLNSFIKKLKLKQSSFSVYQQIQKLQESLNDLKFDYKNNQYYNQKLVDEMKFYINEVFQEPFQNKRFMDFEQVKIVSSDFEQLAESLKQFDDKKQFILKEDVQKNSVGYRAQMLTENKLSINCVVVLDHETFATNSNDQKIKIWGFTPNFVIYEKACIDLTCLCTCMRYLRTKKYLFISLSDKTTIQFDLNNGVNLVKKFVGNERTVQQISLVPEKNLLFSIANDSKLNMYNFEEQNENPIFSLEFQGEGKILDANSDYCVVGLKTGSVLVYNYADSFNSLQYQSEIKASKEKITCLSLPIHNKNQLFVGSENGTLSAFDLSNNQLIHKYTNLHKGRIFGIGIFEGQNNVQYLLTTGWDNQAKLIKTQEKEVVSNTSFQLSFDIKKHWNTDGCKLVYLREGNFYALVIGNNDKKVEILELMFE